MIRQSLRGHSVSQATRTHSSIWPCKEQLTGLVCCWLVVLCLRLCISMEALLKTGHMCRALPWVCVYGDFPGECDITQHGLLLGVLLLLPATPLLESMILHTHTLAPTEVTPTGPNFPLHLQCARSVSTCVYLCVILPSAHMPDD